MQSLTYSASDESYLFASVPVDATHTAWEHLCGAALIQPASPSPPPDSPTSGAETATPFASNAGSTPFLGLGISGEPSIHPGIEVPSSEVEPRHNISDGGTAGNAAPGGTAVTSGWALGRVVGVEPQTPHVTHLQRPVGSLALVSPFAAASPPLKVSLA